MIAPLRTPQPPGDRLELPSGGRVVEPAGYAIASLNGHNCLLASLRSGHPAQVDQATLPRTHGELLRSSTTRRVQSIAVTQLLRRVEPRLGSRVGGRLSARDCRGSDDAQRHRRDDEGTTRKALSLVHIQNVQVVMPYRHRALHNSSDRTN